MMTPHPQADPTDSAPPISAAIFTAAELQRLQLAYHIAHRAAFWDVVTHSAIVRLPDDDSGQRRRVPWLDTRPLLDPRERSAPSIDVSQQHLQFLVEAGSLRCHPLHPHLVRVAELPAEPPLTPPPPSPQEHAA